MMYLPLELFQRKRAGLLAELAQRRHRLCDLPLEGSDCRFVFLTAFCRRVGFDRDQKIECGAHVGFVQLIMRGRVATQASFVAPSGQL